MKKYWIGLILSLLILVLLPASARAATEGDFDYEVNDGKATITKYHGSGGAVEIPSTFGEAQYPVTNIGDSAFNNCSSLTSVTIPSGVTSIGVSAFYNCSSLTSVTIPSSVTSIRYSAFGDCSNITKVFISDIAKWCEISFEDLDSNPLSINNAGTKNLYLNGQLVEELVIPSGVKSITSYAFCGCSSITSVTIPASVTSIEVYAFDCCEKLEEVYYDGSKTEWNKAVGNYWIYNPHPTIYCKFLMTVTASPETGGNVQMNLQGQGPFDPGTEVTLTATAKDGYVFANWTNADGNVIKDKEGKEVGATYTYKPTEDQKLTANFKRPLTITVNDQSFPYNGNPQGENDLSYDDSAVISTKIKVEGLVDGDTLASITLNGTGTEPSEYPIDITSFTIKNGETVVNDKYKVTIVKGKLIIFDELKNISISEQPKKTAYHEGEIFTPEGMKISASYNYDPDKEITNYTYDLTGPLTPDDTTVTISYTENNITKTVQQTISVSAHSYKWVTDKEPTCEAAGTKHEECTVCQAKKSEGTEIPATGHTSGEKETENVKKPTCTEAGSHDEVIYCETCGEEISRETVTDKATGHAWGEWKVTKEPTTAEKGEQQRVCANDSTHIETQEIDKLPEIIYTVSEGADGTWESGSSKGITLTIHRSENDAECINHYQETLIDGKKADVQAKSGSTIITISADTLKTLSAGKHTITVKFDDGEVTTSLTIKEAATQTTPKEEKTPPTGDEARLEIWWMLMLVSLIGITAVVIYNRKHATK